MKLNDLRLGNKLLITDTNEVCTIISFSGKYILYDSGTRSGQALFKCFEPIPLTKEWFAKLGMKYYSLPTKSDNKIGYYTLKYGNRFKINSSNGKYSFLNFRKEIKYVHELQNLYYVLTEKELL